MLYLLYQFSTLSLYKTSHFGLTIIIVTIILYRLQIHDKLLYIIIYDVHVYVFAQLTVI